MIRLESISKVVQSGPEQLTILHPLELEVPKGQFLSIMGPSGSGKSTLLGLIAGLDAPTSGRVEIDGEDLTALGEDALARLRGAKIGFVFQFFHLLPSLTALENVLVPMEIAGISGAESEVPGAPVEKWDFPREPITIPRSSREASSRGWRSPGRSRTTRRSCSPTSPPGISIPRTAGTSSRFSWASTRDAARPSSSRPTIRSSRTEPIAILHLKGGRIERVGRAARRLLRHERGLAPMRFVLRMAVRELRASSRRLLFFFVSIAVGVGAMIALGSVIQSVRAALLKESKSITAADVLIWADRPYSDNARFLIDEKLRKARSAREITRSVESTAMARPELEGGQATTMVELRAVEPAFPFYGTMELAGGVPYSHDLSERTMERS